MADNIVSDTVFLATRLSNGKTCNGSKGSYGVHDRFNNPADTMHVKLQLNVDNGFCEDYYKDYVENGHPMVVKNFKFQEL